MRAFQTESKKLLDLMINSIYTNREIFLRELISNASDAEDKLYFKSLTDQTVDVSKKDLVISLSFDEQARTITVSDAGIGMDEADLEANLGTIAHSDSLEFKQAQAASSQDTTSDDSHEDREVEKSASEHADVDIIGQFGVGFYAAFMVAKNVRVVTKKYGSDQAFEWISDGVEGYEIHPCEKKSYGTDVILTLKDNTDAESFDTFVTEYGLRELVRRYSNYVRYPIQMEVTKHRQKPLPDDAPEDATPEWEEYREVETINSMIPIWKRRKSEVSDEEYQEFYKGQFHDYANPLRTISVHAEGSISYDVLLFIPSKRPYDLWSRDFKRGLQLYSSNVLIMDSCEELLPEHYGFVRGVVDSQDLTLNISRETLQHNNQLSAIARKVEKKITSELERMLKDDRALYEQFFAEFGRSLKYGIYSSYGMKKSELEDLLLFYSAKQQKLVTLAEYRESMTEDQQAIYYATGEATERLAKMPLVKSVLNRGFDVLLCTQDIDDFCLQTMQKSGDVELKNVASGNLDLETESDKTAAEAVSKENEGLLSALKEALGESVVRVAVSQVLTDAPAALSAEGPVSLEMEKIMAAMPDAEGVKSQRVLELSVSHPVFEALRQAHKAGDTEKVADYAHLLYDQALLMEGMPIDDPVAFAQRVSALMK